MRAPFTGDPVLEISSVELFLGGLYKARRIVAEMGGLITFEGSQRIWCKPRHITSVLSHTIHTSLGANPNYPRRVFLSDHVVGDRIWIALGDNNTDFYVDQKNLVDQPEFTVQKHGPGPMFVQDTMRGHCGTCWVPRQDDDFRGSLKLPPEHFSLLLLGFPRSPSLPLP